MRIVIIGGTGRIGSKVVSMLRERGHDAVAAAPETGVNTLTGEGLAEVLKGADVVIDVSNSPSFEAGAALKFFRTSTGNLLAAEAAAGVRHHVVLSVVGVDRLADVGYFRAKVAQEEMIRSSPIPWSIVHATQFFEFLKGIADDATGDGSLGTHRRCRQAHTGRGSGKPLPRRAEDSDPERPATEDRRPGARERHPRAREPYSLRSTIVGSASAARRSGTTLPVTPVHAAITAAAARLHASRAATP